MGNSASYCGGCAMTNYSFQFPVINGKIPIWKNNNFYLNDEILKVLEYSVNNAGWTDELTEFHEETAGENHFIDTASRENALKQTQQYVQDKESTVILEVGCSSGFMLKTLRDAFPKSTVIGTDVVRAPLIKLSKEISNVPLLLFDLVNCPLPDNCVDAVVMLNVLEHIENDLGALQQVMRILKPGGVVVIEVPAGPNLYDIYDKILMHYRRYTLSSLQKQTEAAGFTITKKSHLGFFMYPGFWFVKQRNKRLSNESLAIQQQEIEKNIQSTGDNKILHTLMRFELFLGKKISYPIGIRCLMTCVKK